jgi:hypothetical protein
MKPIRGNPYIVFLSSQSQAAVNHLIDKEEKEIFPNWERFNIHPPYFLGISRHSTKGILSVHTPR